MVATRLAGPALAVLLAACGGGGGGGTPTLPAANMVTPAPAALPDVAGSVVDDATGQALAGALVIVSGSTVIAGATPPAIAVPWPSATTASDGSFDVKNVPASTWTDSYAYLGAGYPVYANAQWIEIFPADGHAAFHAVRSVAPAGTTNLGNVAVALPSAVDTAWLGRINGDRATTGFPAATAPLTFDSITLQTARFWAQQMDAGGFFAHTCPAASVTCIPFWLYETQHGSPPSSQNIYEGAAGTWLPAETAFMAEAANCPAGNWQTCSFGETTGHYINIMQATNWAGVALAQGYAVENFCTPAGNALYSQHVPKHPHPLQF